MVKTYNITDTEFEICSKILGEPNLDKNRLSDFYITLGQSSSSKGIMFVLYRLQLKVTSSYVDPFKFVCILSDDIINACRKAKEICGNNNIFIEVDSHKLRKQFSKPNIIPFGKYEGMDINVLLETNPEYIFWLSNNYNGKLKGLIERLSQIKEEAKNKVIENNREKNTSFVGIIGETMTVFGKIYSVEKIPNGFNSESITKLKFIDINGNRFIKSGIMKETFTKDEKIKITGKIKSQYETMGIKINSFGGICKITKLLE